MSEKYCQVNIGSIAILNDAILRNQLSTNKIVLASSRAIYGDAKLDDVGDPLPAREDDIPNPISLYAVTKLAQEQLVRVGFGGIDKCILRFQNVYGPGQSLINPYTGIMSIFSNLIQENKTIQIFEDGKMSRDFVYIDDIVSALVLSLQSNVKNETFNVGSGQRVTVYDLVCKLQNLFGKQTQIQITGQKRIGDIRHNYADITRIRSFGFKPQYTLDAGMRNFVNWVQTQNVTVSNYEESLNELRKNNLLK
jgi:dTDP-L-rhamnose 4-epimerase